MGYRVLQRITRSSNGLWGVVRDYNGLQGIARSYNGLQLVTRDYRGLHTGYYMADALTHELFFKRRREISYLQTTI